MYQKARHEWGNYNVIGFDILGNSSPCSAWLSQCAVYIVIVLLEKILMTLLVLFDFWKDVSEIYMCIKNYIKII